jgi:nitrogen fixation NifU-like protein
MKIHCGQMVEGALRAALNASSQDTAPTPATPTPPAQPSGNLAESLVAAPTTAGRIKISLLPR